MPKNDLSAFKRKPKASILKTATPAPAVQEPKPKPAPKAKKKPGKPPKPEKEKLSKRCQVMLTIAEFDKLEKGRGAVPLSTFLRLKLKEKGIV